MPRRERELPSGTVTFLFTDIEGSTGLVHRLGVRWPDILEAHRRLLRDAFTSHAGVEVGTEGDAFFVAFGEASDAVAAAVDAQRALAGAPWPEGDELRVRIGIHTGEGRVIHRDYVGLDVHLAARIAAAAHGGQVLISDPTRALVERALPAGVTIRDLGAHRLKDMTDPERLFQLVMAGLPGDFPPPHSMERVVANLPAVLSSFVGRDRELAELRELIDQARLVTLIGPAGTGKTRLAIEVARGAAEGFRDGACFVPLAALTEPAQVPAAIASAAGIREVGTKATVAVLQDHFRGRRTLLLLDNFEHLLAAGSVVTDLLNVAPGLTIVTTSQAELRVTGERLYPVVPLAAGDASSATPSDATRLFVERAMAVAPDFRLTPEHARTIVEICRRLDGLPLAIELAAARVRILDVDEILRRLDSRLRLLTAGPSDAPDRHRTLRAALDWSYELLGPHEAVLFRRLAVFAGGTDLAAIERVCGNGDDPMVGRLDDALAALDDPLAALDELVRHSLVQADAGATRTRYRMLETVREFALERLSESGESRAVRRRHAIWYADLLESVAPLAKERASATDVSAPELDNVLSALEWAAEARDIGLGLRITGATWRVWEQWRRLREGLSWTRRFLELDAGTEHVTQRIHALETAGGIAYWLGENEAAVAAYRERLALALDHGPPREVADAHLDLVFAFSNQGDLEAAKAEAAAARAVYDALGDELGQARCAWFESSAMVFQHRFAEARIAVEAILPVFRRYGDVNYASLAMGSLAMSSLALGDVRGAERWFREVLTTGAGVSAVGVISGLGTWSKLLERIGYPRLAARFEGAYEALSRTYGVEMAPRLREVTELVLRQTSPPAALDEAGRRALNEEGRRLSLDEALELARTLETGQADAIATMTAVFEDA